VRLLELRLIAFGLFSDETLDLSDPGLHVVYGPNEAGKSTSLRAISGLLYGIPERTPDAHLHLPKALRIGGRISFGDETIDVVRRKGRKNTLLSPAEQPLDEATVKRALGGVSRELFLSMFGLDHRTLRDGAKALLKGEGAVGESLFDAGGARGIGDVLAGLRAEADQLYKAKGRNQLLNQALADLKESHTSVTISEVSPRAFVEQRHAHDDAKQQRDDLMAEQQRLLAERERLERAMRVLPHLAKLNELRKRRDAVGDVPQLPADAAQRRVEALRALAEGELVAGRLAKEVAALTAQRDAVVVDEVLAQVDDHQVERVKKLLGRHDPAAVDMPKREAQLRAHEEQARLRLRELGRTVVDLDEVEALRLDKIWRTRIESLSKERGGLVATLEAADKQLRDARGRLEQLEDRLAEQPAARDAAALRAVVDRAVRAGDLDVAVAKGQAHCRGIEERAHQKRAALSRCDGRIKQVAALALPSRETVREQLQRWRRDDDSREALEERARDIGQEREHVQRGRDELDRGGDVPTEETLATVRAERDAQWVAVREAMAANKKVPVDGYELAVGRADDVADRLRREADRVARRVRLEADEASIERRARAVADELQALDEAIAKGREAWRTLWPAAVEPAEPSAMLGWLDDHRELLSHVDELSRARQEQAEIEVTRAELRASVARELTALGEAVPSGERLVVVVDRGRSLADGIESTMRCRADLTKQCDELRVDVETLAMDRGDHAEQLQRWQKEWAEGMKRLGLAGDASVAEASVVLSTLQELFDKVREASDVRKRIEGMHRDAAEFDSLLRPLLETQLPAMASAPLGEAAASWVSRQTEACKARDDRAALSERLETHCGELRQAEQRCDRARGQLDDLVRAAGVDDSDALEAVEQRVLERSKLDQDIAEVEDALFQEGVSIDVLQAHCADIDISDARARVPEIMAELEDLQQQLKDANTHIGGLRVAIERFEQSTGAHDAAHERQACLASVRRLAERYAKVRLAAVILAQEIERYREQNQGPIVRRASELFPRLTLGEYAQLRVEFDTKDQPALRCVGVDGADVGVDGLSDGARDQLYLALRLASLERYAEHAELMPFIADDILVHFDEDRARAALEVLQEFGKTTQVLMFTHQARHVELAREVVAADALRVHQLRGGRRRARSA